MRNAPRSAPPGRERRGPGMQAVLVLLAAACGPAAAQSGRSAAEKIGREGGEITDEQARQIEQVLHDFANAVLTRQEGKAAQLVVPTGRRQARRHIRDELSVNTYDLFEFVPLRIEDFHRQSADVVELRPVLRYQYADANGDAIGATQAYLFVFRLVDGVWYIDRSELIDQFTGMNMDSLATWLLLILIGIVIALVFSGWMVFDCSLRYHRMDLTLAVLLAPLVGPLVYFILGVLPPGRPAIGRRIGRRARAEV